MKINTAYDEIKPKPMTKGFEPTLTKQALVEEAEINHIVKKYVNTSYLADLQELESIYGEITHNDLLEAKQKVIAAEETFMQIPSSIRKQFDNNVGLFIDYATNPDNIKQMADWGLARLPDGFYNEDGTRNTDGDITTGNEANPEPNPIPEPPKE